MLFVDKDTKEVFRLCKEGKQRLCVIETPTKISICKGSGITLGGIAKCFSTIY